METQLDLIWLVAGLPLAFGVRALYRLIRYRNIKHRRAHRRPVPVLSYIDLRYE